MSEPTLSRPLWGPIDVPSGAIRRWVLGPLVLWIERRPVEWVVSWMLGDDPLAPAFVPGAPSEPAPAAASTQRFAIHREGGLELRPQLADRRVVVRPETPLHVVDETVLYVSTPLWIALRRPGTDVPMLVLPSWRPSDTWFGPSTREGTLAYGSTTRGRFSPSDLADLPARVATRVHIVNHAPLPLLVARIGVPVTNLELWCARDGRLWTNAIGVARGADGVLGVTEVLPGPPPEAERAVLLAEAVVPPRAHGLAAAFGALLA